MNRRPFYQAHGWLTERMFSRDPPHLYLPERVALWLVRAILDRFEMSDFNRRKP